MPLTVAFGLAHVVAAYGLIRRRDWSRNLVGYLAAIGIGVAAYGLLLALTGLDPIGATSTLPSARAWAEGLGLLIWLIGLWLVAARYAFKGITPERQRGPAVASPRRGGRGDLTRPDPRHRRREPRDRGPAGRHVRLGRPGYPRVVATETLSLYERAGGEPFFEALVGALLRRRRGRPLAAPDLSRGGPGARARDG